MMDSLPFYIITRAFWRYIYQLFFLLPILSPRIPPPNCLPQVGRMCKATITFSPTHHGKNLSLGRIDSRYRLLVESEDGVLNV